MNGPRSRSEPSTDRIDRCRSCGLAALHLFLDLGDQPLANRYPAADDPSPEPRWPLRVGVCSECHLVQLLGDVPAEPQLPGEAPFAQSSTMRDHARGFVEALLGLPGAAAGTVVNVASHGGYLYPFLADRGVDSLVVEGSPTLVTDLRASDVPVHPKALGRGAAAEILAYRPPASLVVDNYLLSHVPNPSELVAGIRDLLAPDGWAVFELDHALPIVVEGQFDAFRHGHFTYWSLTSVDALLRRHGLLIVDVTEQAVYGGALRVIAQRQEDVASPVGAAPQMDSTLPAAAVARILDQERAAGLAAPGTYEGFATRVASELRKLREFLINERTNGRLVVGYGAPTRGSTLLNAAGIGPELLPFTVDRSPSKQGRLMPGCRVPIDRPERLLETAPAVVLILTWDISAEIVAQQHELRDRGARFMVPIPALEVVGP